MPDFDEVLRQYMKEADQIKSTQSRSEASTAIRKELAKDIAISAIKEGGVMAAGLKIAEAAPIVQISTSLGSSTPIMWAVKPWVAAFDVAKVAFSLERVYALMNENRGIWKNEYECKEEYECTCASRQKQGYVVWNKKKQAQYGVGERDRTHMDCKAVRDFLVNQKEIKVARIAISASVVGIPFYMLYSACRSIYKRASGTIHQDRAQAAQHLVRNATPALGRKNGDVVILEKGCRRAQALVALLCRELDLKTPASNFQQYPKTMAAFVHPDGWDTISSSLSAAMITDAGSGKALAAPSR